MLKTFRTTRRGMALPIILIALFVFSIIMFAIAQQQQHETRFTAISLEQQRAFVLADAGLARALARHVARSYHNRWYGAAPGMKDDALPALEHAGRFDESSQNVDETGAGGAPSIDRKLEPQGTYEVLVEDRHTGELEGGEATADVRLAFTDVYSRGTIDGPHGEVSCLIFARMAVSPEPSFFGQTAGVTPSLVVDESTPELVKRVIRYQVYFDADTAGRRYLNPNADTAGVQALVHHDIALFHQNFLKNRNTFADLRDPGKVNATWQQGSATTAQWTPDQIKGLFAGFAGPAAVPGGTSAPDATNGQFANLWTDHMLRRYRVSDLVPANTGIKYVIGSGPTAQGDRVAGNILRAFGEPPLVTVRPEFKEDANPGVTTGDQLLNLQGGQANLDQARQVFNTEVSCFSRKELTAVILKGVLYPRTAPQPDAQGNPPPPLPEPAGSRYEDDIFLQRFLTTDVPPTILNEMKAEIARVNAIGANPPLTEGTYIVKGNIGTEYYPIFLRYTGVNGAPPPPVPPGTPGTASPGSTKTQLSVPELVKLYGKYIETAAVFTGGSPAQITPIPPVPTTPPPDRPVPPPNNGGGSSGGGGSGGAGGGRPTGVGIGGRGSSM